MEELKKEWKEVEYYGKIYRVSNYGDVVSMVSGKTLKNRLNPDGYPVVTLGVDGMRRVRPVHRLVAESFVEKPDDFDSVKYEVNHDDFDIENYRADNLTWMTHTENIQYTIDAGRHASTTMDYTGENNPNYGNDTLKKKYAENPELAKQNNSRPGSKNGRCVPVYVTNSKGKFIRSFNYKRECAKWLIDTGKSACTVDTTVERINKSIKNKKTYQGFYFHKGEYIESK